MPRKLTLGQRKHKRDIERRVTLKRQIARLLGHKKLVRPRKKLPLGNVPQPIFIPVTQLL